jgi:D-3-phosphoglycerate dehydrogenase
MVGNVGVTVGLFARIPVMRDELLAAYPEAKLNEADGVLSEDELIGFLSDCDAAIVGLEPITDRLLAALPRLRVIAKFGVGIEGVDFASLRKYRIRFGYHQAGVNSLSVAELTLAFAICGLRGVSAANQAMRAGLRPRQNLGRQLTGRVFGLHGCGSIGKEVVRLLQPFGCTVFACDVRDYPHFYGQYGVTPVSFEELIARSEVLSLHLPLTPRTKGLYDAAVLSALRDDCILINTSRGGIVDEGALRERLESGKLQAACFDVFAVEPAIDDRLLRNPGLLSTPHIGASAVEARLAMARAAIRGLTENALVEPGQFADA